MLFRHTSLSYFAQVYLLPVRPRKYASSILHGFRGANSPKKWSPAALKFADNWRVHPAAIEAFTGKQFFATISTKISLISAIFKTERLHSFERVDRCLRVIQVSTSFPGPSAGLSRQMTLTPKSLHGQQRVQNWQRPGIKLV